MAFFTEVEAHVFALRALLGEDAAAADLSEALGVLGDDDLIAAMRAAAALVRCAERVGVVGAGIVASRSRREAGHAGLAQARGHRNPADLVQELTGASRAEAVRQVRVGTTLLESGGPVSGVAGHGGTDAAPVTGGPDAESTTGASGGVSATNGTAPAAAARALSWHAPADTALLEGAISSTQHDAIVRGLGEPPALSADEDAMPDAERDALRVAAREAWTIAAEQLVTEAAVRTVEELASTARAVRDRLDPAGAEARFLARFEARCFRMWTDRDGLQRGSFTFDDEAALWVRTIIDAAMRPRRGGPRFVDSAEAAKAQSLVDDPRTNDQLVYDLMIDVLRAGALADAATVFGTRQAGVRIMRVMDRNENPDRTAFSEDGLVALPGGVAEQHICDTGIVAITADSAGNPLDIGREQRLFTPRQRIGLAARDGGCRWPNCDRPASYCEAHHSTQWSAGGRTDIDDGILLCRFHHMNLHHHGWRISRDGPGEFTLHHPEGESSSLRPRLTLTYAWAGIDPPPERFPAVA
jgi:hypothetical protein